MLRLILMRLAKSAFSPQMAAQVFDRGWHADILEPADQLLQEEPQLNVPLVSRDIEGLVVRLDAKEEAEFLKTLTEVEPKKRPGLLKQMNSLLVGPEGIVRDCGTGDLSSLTAGLRRLDGDEESFAQVEKIVKNYPGDPNFIGNFLIELAKVEPKKRPALLKHMNSLLIGPEGTVRDGHTNSLWILLSGLRELNEDEASFTQTEKIVKDYLGDPFDIGKFLKELAGVDAKRRPRLLERMNSLLVGPEGTVRNGEISDLSYLVHRLIGLDRPVARDEGDELVGQVSRLLGPRTASAYEVASALGILESIPRNQRRLALRQVNERMDVGQVIALLQRFGGGGQGLPQGAAYEVHKVAAKELKGKRDEMAAELGAKATALLSEDAASEVVLGWIQKHPLLDEENQTTNRALMEQLLEHPKWGAAMNMRFGDLGCTGSELFRLSVAYILDAPEGEQRNARIAQFLEQGLIDAIGAYVKNPQDLDSASCVAGIAERIGGLWARQPHESVNDIGALIMKNPDYMRFLNLAAEDIPAEIKKSLDHIPKVVLGEVWQQEVDNILQAERQRLIESGREQKAVDEAIEFARGLVETSEEEVAEVWQRLHPS